MDDGSKPYRYFEMLSCFPTLIVTPFKIQQKSNVALILGLVFTAHCLHKFSTSTTVTLNGLVNNELRNELSSHEFHQTLKRHILVEKVNPVRCQCRVHSTSSRNMYCKVALSTRQIILKGRQINRDNQTESNIMFLVLFFFLDKSSGFSAL